MSIFRYIVFWTLSFFLLATIFCWVASYFRLCTLRYAGQDSESSFAFGAGVMRVSVWADSSSGPGYRIGGGFKFEWEKLPPHISEYVKTQTTMGFSHSSHWPGNHALTIPFWFAAFWLGAAAAFIFWRIRAAQRRVTAPAFPVDVAGGKA